MRALLWFFIRFRYLIVCDSEAGRSASDSNCSQRFALREGPWFIYSFLFVDFGCFLKARDKQARWREGCQRLIWCQDKRRLAVFLSCVKAGTETSGLSKSDPHVWYGKNSLVWHAGTQPAQFHFGFFFQLFSLKLNLLSEQRGKQDILQ